MHARYAYADDFRNGFAGVGLNYRYGFIDKTGDEVVLRKYDWVESFYENRAAVYKENKWGL